MAHHNGVNTTSYMACTITAYYIMYYGSACQYVGPLLAGVVASVGSIELHYQTRHLGVDRKLAGWQDGMKAESGHPFPRPSLGSGRASLLCSMLCTMYH